MGLTRLSEAARDSRLRICVPCIIQTHFSFSTGCYQVEADVWPYLRADWKALGGSVKRRKIKRLWDSSQGKNTSTLALAVQDGFEFRG